MNITLRAFCICGTLLGGLPLAAQTDRLTIGTAPVKTDIALVCNFTTECFDADTCTDAAFEPTLTGRAGGMSLQDMVAQVKFSSEAGDADLLGLRSDDAMSLSGGTFEARHLLTINKDGAARYTVHYADGPMAISYLGICK